MVRSLLRLSAVAFAGIGATGCMSMNDPLAYDFGYAVANNDSQQLIRSEPVDLDPAALDGMEGQRGVAAYRAGEVKEVKKESTKTSGGGGGGGGGK